MFRKSMVSVVLLVMSIVAVSSSVYSQSDINPNEPMPFYLLTIRGTLASATRQDAQAMHNETAGAPESMAAARSMGDLSHMVYVPLAPAETGAGEVLFMDQWNSIEGLNQFFANPDVQEQAGQLFSERNAVVWTPAEGFYSYHLSTPYGSDDRVIAMVSGTVHSREEAMAVHNAIVGSQINVAHMAGDLSHEAYFQLSPPGEPESLEFLAVDVWNNAEGMAAYYGDPNFQSGVLQLFTSAPTVSAWNQTTGEWVEW